LGAKTEESLLSDFGHADQINIQLGHLALAKGYSARVRKFGQRLADDRMSADKDLTDTAIKEGFRLKKSPPGFFETVTFRRLRMAVNNHFDTLFIKTIVDNQGADVEKLGSAMVTMNRYSTTGRLLDRLLPTLRSDQRIARQLSPP